MKHIILCAALLLTACASTPAEPVLARHPQAADMQPCTRLDQPADGKLGSLYRYGVTAAHQYNDCAARHVNLINWVKRGLDREQADALP